jgi:DNA-directed RNA polymerase beta' subunit
MIIKNLIVLPTVCRLPVKSGDVECHDDITYKYIDIIKANNKLADAKSLNEKKINELIDALDYHITMIMDNTKNKITDKKKRMFKCIHSRLKGKNGLIRKHMCGKRVNFCARTVIGPEANCMVDEIIIPKEVASKLTFPVRVTEFNIKECYKWIEQEKVAFVMNEVNGNKEFFDPRYAGFERQGTTLDFADIIMKKDGTKLTYETLYYAKGNNIIQEGDKVLKDGKFMPIVLPKKKKIKLEIGYIVERQLMDGDWVLLNRQPSLRAESLRAKKVKILPCKTFRFNLASTEAFNADFDGDEMNIWLPQSYESLAELIDICSVEANFTTSQHSRPIIAMKQDSMTGGYLLTYGDVKIDKATFFDCLMVLEDMDVMTKYDHIKEVYRWKGVEAEVEDQINKEIFELEKKRDILKEKKNNLEIKIKSKNKDLKVLKETVSKIKEVKTKLDDIEEQINNLNQNFEGILEERLMFNGRTLFSFLLPDNFEYTFQNNMDPNNKAVVITRGVMLSGTLNKSVMGSASGSISHMLRLNYSSRKACEFVSYYQMIIARWLLTRGFSVGISDCIPNNINSITPNMKIYLKPNHLVDLKKDNILMRMKNKCVVTDDVIKTNQDESTLIKSETSKCFSQALLHMQTEEDEELRELKINNSLNNARDVGQRIAKESLSPYNSFVCMIRSGAKGNDNNITQITSMLGQQNAEGKRMPLVFNKRSLPHFIPSFEEYVATRDSTSRMLEKMFSSRGFVHSGFYKGLEPHEFFFHAAGGREGLIDTACKSVVYETEIVILEDGKTRTVKIGEWIDDILSKNKEITYDNSENEDRELAKLDEEVFIPTSDLKGNVSWGKITAVTRHNPTQTMYEIKTIGGRNVTVTDSHSLLVWNETKHEFERVKPEFVSVGSFVPTTANLVEPSHVSKYFDVTSLLPKTEYIHGTDFLKAKTMIEEVSKENNKTPRGWWDTHNGKDFVLPYTKVQMFLRSLWRSNIESIKEHCIYPYGASKSDAMVNDKFEFTFENGLFLGLYIADGNCGDSYIAITKNDTQVLSFIEKWFDKYNIKHSTKTKINKIGGTTTTIRGYSTLLSTIISTLGGKGAVHKHIHDSCLNGSIDFIKGLLSGIFSGDGWITKNSIEFSTASSRLADNVNMCLSRLGIFGKSKIVKIGKNNLNTPNPLDSNRISIRGQWVNVFKNNITLVSSTKQEKLNIINPSEEHRNFKVQNDVVLDKIVSIEKVSITHKKVYDLTVPSTLNFGLANGLHVVDTAETGYVQRKMVKMLEDLTVSYDGSVRDAYNHIISFDYGGDNFDGAKIIYRDSQPLFMDIDSICNKLNADYEWETK